MRSALLLALTGCRTILGFEDPSIDRDGGGDVIDSLSVQCTDWAYVPTEFDPCDIALPVGDLVLGPGTHLLDSTSGTLTGPGGIVSLQHAIVNNRGVISVNRLDIPAGAVLRGVGALPLVIATWDSATISGTLDVSSAGIIVGAGANSSACLPGTNGSAGPNGDGGGGGGGFANDGGDGGTGDDGAASRGQHGRKRPRPSTIEGGCSGHDAGPGPDGARGTGGAGGGAVAVVANTTLTVNGIINVGGSGGTGGMIGNTGGGGGGSGGMIKLEASSLSVTVTAILAANGGQGGGGCQNGIAGPGVNGGPNANEPVSGNSEGSGTDGGRGGYVGGDMGGNASFASAGGGGGGGGAGFIVHRGTSSMIDPSAIVSPDSQTF